MSATEIDAPKLVRLLSQAQTDASRIVGNAAGLRLAGWKAHEDNTAALAVWIRQRLMKKTTFGKQVETEGGLSLERIIIDYAPELFTKQDYWEAKRSLGLPV